MNKRYLFSDFFSSLFRIFFFIFYFICVFDPAGLLTRLKTPIFLFILFIFIIYSFYRGLLVVPKDIIIFIVIFSILIPISSILNVVLFQSEINTFPLVIGALKTNLFLTIVLIFFGLKKIFIKDIIINLTLLSVVIIIFHFLVLQGFYPILQDFGVKYKIYHIASGVFFGSPIYRIYFWASPLLVFSIGYFSNLVIKQPRALLNYVLLLINIIAMYYSGSRINIAVSFLTFFIIWFFYITKKSFPIFIIIFITIITFLFLKIENIYSMLNNSSDQIKFGMLNDYLDIYNSKIVTLLFGQGLGSEFFFTGRNAVMSFTELTYFEIIRKFGVILGGVILLLMFYPILKTWHILKENRWVIAVYGIYIVMAFFNPFYFSSNGMIILAITLFYIYDNRETENIILKL